MDEYKEYTDFAEEVLRFAMCHEVSTYEDSDITKESIMLAYKTHLQNGIGNQVNRILKLSSEYLSEADIKNILQGVENKDTDDLLDKDFVEYLNNFKVNEAAHYVTNKVKELDVYIQKEAPFKKVKVIDELEEGKRVIGECVKELLNISLHLSFFMPRTSTYIYECISKNKMPERAIFGRAT